MDERPFPHSPLPQPPPSRRGFLLAGGLAAVAAGSGAWLAASGDSSTAAPSSPALTRELHAAAMAERDLIARVDAAAKHAQGSRREALRTIRADHVAHLGALEASLAEALYPLAAQSASPTAEPAPSGRVRVADVRSGEHAAARAAAARAARLTGPSAVLLASISAAEATHAELLS